MQPNPEDNAAIEKALRNGQLELIGPIPARGSGAHDVAVANVAQADLNYRRVKAQSAERVKRYREARDEVVRAAHADGLSYSRIAAVLGVSRSRVQRLVERASSRP